MRYRMDKIKRILDDDINDMEVFLELKLAFAIKRYRENRTCLLYTSYRFQRQHFRKRECPF